jgi:hypothetical protein
LSTTQARAVPSNDRLENAAIIAATVGLGPLPVLAGGLIGRKLSRGVMPWAALAALAGSLGFYWFAASMQAQLLAAASAIHDQRVLAHPERLLSAVWPHLWRAWLIGLFASPMVALLAALRDRGDSLALNDPVARREQAERTLERRAVKRARKLAETPEQKPGLFLGYRVSGDEQPLAFRRGKAFLPWPLAERSLLVVGASGSGKTETLLRLAFSTALARDTRVIYLDAKGDRENMERFGAVMEHAGRTPRVFPQEPFDGWLGDAAEQANRLLEVIDYADRGGGTFYRDLAVKIVRLACDCPAGPPRNSVEFLRRLNKEVLQTEYADRTRLAEAERQRRLSELEWLNPEHVHETRARYEAFFGTVGDALDGRMSFADIEAGYFLLDGLRLKSEAAFVAKFLVEDFTQWVALRKPRGERVLLIVDEFSAIAMAASSLVDVVERTRGFEVAAVLAPQSAEGMGGKEAAARIIGSTRTILLHSVPYADDLVRVAGSRKAYSLNEQIDAGRFTGLGSVNQTHVYKVDPNDVRRLRVGQCYAIADGQATKLQIVPAPTLARLRDEGEELISPAADEIPF